MYMFRSYNTIMVRKIFKKRDLAETLRLVCLAKGGELVYSGKPNSSALAAKVKEKQPTVNRWLRGESSPTEEKIRALCKGLRLTPSQLFGEEPIPYVDGEVYKNEDDYFAKKFPKLPEKLKKAILYQMELEEDSDRTQPGR